MKGTTITESSHRHVYVSATLAVSIKTLISILFLLVLLSSVPGRALAQGTHNHAHPTDPNKAREHMAMLDLVDTQDATSTAVKSGRWSDPTIWSSGKVPTTNGKVYVPLNTTVTYDVNSEAEIRWLRVDGVFRFDPTATTLLKIDTIVITPDGSLEQGTPKTPIDPSVTSTVLFTDYGPIDRDYDPHLLSRGLIAHGSSLIQGATRTRFLPLTKDALKGTTQVELISQPEGWRVGDELLLTSTTRMDRAGKNPRQNESLKIAQIQGRTITFDKALAFDHISPGNDHNGHRSIYLVNFTNNIKYESVNHDMSDDGVRRHGHVMFMHSEKVSVSSAEFNYLGRTNKKYEINDVFPEYNSPTTLTAGTGTNVRGRYALHVHRTSKDVNSTVTLIDGVSVRYSPGWGIVNHQSYVNVMNSAVAYVHGSAFVEESGDGLGAFRDNIAVEIYHSGKNREHRENHVLSDVCFHGVGYCFRGNNVKSENCTAVDTEVGFAWINKYGEGKPVIPATSLPHPGLANNGSSLQMLSVPTTVFRDSTVVNAYFAVDSGYWYVFQPIHGGRNFIDNFRAYNVNQGLAVTYTTNLSVRNFRATMAPEASSDSVGANFANFVSGETVLDDVVLTGFKTGVLYGPNVKLYIVSNSDFSKNDTPISDISQGKSAVINVPASSLQVGRFSFTPDDLGEIVDANLRSAGFRGTGTVTDTLGTKTITADGIEAGMFRTPATNMQQVVARGIYGDSTKGHYLVLKFAYMDRITGALHPVNFKLPFNEKVLSRLRAANSDLQAGPDIGEFVSELGTPALKINAGGPATSGFSADTAFSGSSSAINVSGNNFDLYQWNSAPQSIYSTARQGNNFSYKLSGLAANTRYTVRLHFNEHLYTQPSKRIFDVAVNGTEVLPRFDILADAGITARSVVKDIEALADSSGTITVALKATTDSPDQNALISGIEVLSDFGRTQAPKASFSPRAGVYYGEQYVMLISDAPDAKIRYTLDGSTPTLSSALYTGPFTIDKTTTIKTIVDIPGLRPSDVDTGVYSIIKPSDTIRYNLGGDQVENFAPDTISLAQLAPFGSSVQDPYTTKTTSAIDVSTPNAGPAAIYQNGVEQRWYGLFPEIIQNLYPGLKYTLRLHFAEYIPENNYIGARMFDIWVNGVQVKDHFDVFAQAGGKMNKAVVIDIPNVQADRLGQVFITFMNTNPADDPAKKQRDGAAFANALELIPPKLVAPMAPSNLRSKVAQ